MSTTKVQSNAPTTRSSWRAQPLAAQGEDGALLDDLRLVVIEMDGGKPGLVQLLDGDEVLLQFGHTDQMHRLALELERAADRLRSMLAMSSEVVVSANLEREGALEARSGYSLALRRIADDRVVIDGQMIPSSPYLKHYAWSDEQGQVIGVPAGMTLRRIKELTARDIAWREAVPRLYRALLAAEREAAQSVARTA